MRTTNVIVLPYDRAWKSDFEEIKKYSLANIRVLKKWICCLGKFEEDGISSKYLQYEC